MKTEREYTVNFRDYGSVTVPAGTHTTHKTACGINENYNFVNSFKWVEPYPDGTPQYGLLHDLKYYGLNVPPEYMRKMTLSECIKANVTPSPKLSEVGGSSRRGTAIITRRPVYARTPCRLRYAANHSAALSLAAGADMSQLLTAKQRSQALAWYSVCGFSPRTISKTFGITTEQMASELRTAMTERTEAGKSPEPVPLVPGNGQERLTGEALLLESLKALEQIVWLLDSMTPQAAINESKHVASKALKSAGRII